MSPTMPATKLGVSFGKLKGGINAEIGSFVLETQSIIRQLIGEKKFVQQLLHFIALIAWFWKNII